MMRSKYFGLVVIVLLLGAYKSEAQITRGVYELLGINDGFFSLEPVDAVSGNFKYVIKYIDGNHEVNPEGLSLTGGRTTTITTGKYRVNGNSLILGSEEMEMIYKINDNKLFSREGETWIWLPEQPSSPESLFALFENDGTYEDFKINDVFDMLEKSLK
jgi:hypothetical protein